MIINDPVFGFIEVPEGILSDLVQHPLMIRLTRLRQLGPTFYVYPGAMHTRFLHSVGAFHLVREAVKSLREKSIDLSKEEELGVEMAMLLHDVGHGPMSHALEHTLVKGMGHEEISLKLMKRLNDELGGALDLAIQIYSDTYPRHFLHELVCSQLDMDRLDYLSRDSFFTGVREGNIGVARILKMLGVENDRLVVESKGIYTIENYLMARRLMYWQVYYHKTAMAAQEVLVMTLHRARTLARTGRKLFATPDLAYLLYNDVSGDFLENHPEWLNHYVGLDDSDLETALEQWALGDDRTLALLAGNFVNRHLFKAKEMVGPMDDERLEALRKRMAELLQIPKEEAEYFVRQKEVGQMLYSSADDHIHIHFQDGSTSDVSEISELLRTELVDKQSRRHYLFYQRNVAGFIP